MRYLDREKLEKIISECHDGYLKADPYPHVVIDGFTDEAALDRVAAEFEGLKEKWIYYHHFNEKKRGFNKTADMGPVTRAFFEDFGSPEFIRFLERLTGIERLLCDPDLDGGGLHEMKRGGFLNMHADFMSHTVRKTWSRRVNLLLFLNRNWEDAYNGCLELWDRGMKRRVRKIEPFFNRCVIFNTSDISFHGVPDPVLCPEGRSRKSMALYYFRDEKKVCPLVPTNYKPRPSDSVLKKVGVRFDRAALALYSFIKRHVPVSEPRLTRLLKLFSK